MRSGHNHLGEPQSVQGKGGNRREVKGDDIQFLKEISQKLSFGTELALKSWCSPRSRGPSQEPCFGRLLNTDEVVFGFVLGISEHCSDAENSNE